MFWTFLHEVSSIITIVQNQNELAIKKRKLCVTMLHISHDYLAHYIFPLIGINVPVKDNSGKTKKVMYGKRKKQLQNQVQAESVLHLDQDKKQEAQIEERGNFCDSYAFCTGADYILLHIG